jgi:hypothetical protein
MASIGQLVRSVSHVSGLEEGSVKLIARYIREAGFIGQQSTGAGAAQMSYADAASILIAVNAASLAKDAAETVRKYGRLPINYSSVFDETASDLARIYSAITHTENFVDALASLIEFCAEENSVFIDVEFLQPKPQVFVRIRAGENDIDDLGKTAFSCVFKADRNQSSFDGDRVVRVNITHRTLRTLAKTIQT